MRIGEILIKQCIISETIRDNAFEIQKKGNPHRFLDKILVETEAISHSSLSKPDILWYFWLGYANVNTNQISGSVQSYENFLNNSQNETRYTCFARKQLQELAC